MDNVVDISWVKLALFGLILLVPFFLSMLATN